MWLFFVINGSAIADFSVTPKTKTQLALFDVEASQDVEVELEEDEISENQITENEVSDETAENQITESEASENETAEIITNQTALVAPTNWSFPDADFYPVGTKAKLTHNYQAIELIKELEAKNRGATKAEQEIIAKYVGFGGLQNAFNPTDEA